MQSFMDLFITITYLKIVFHPFKVSIKKQLMGRSFVHTGQFLKNIKEWKNSTCWLVLVFIVKLWFSVLLNLETLIVNYPRITNDVALSNL